jgi:hypothetical protein
MFGLVCSGQDDARLRQQLPQHIVTVQAGRLVEMKHAFTGNLSGVPPGPKSVPLIILSLLVVFKKFPVHP